MTAKINPVYVRQLRVGAMICDIKDSARWGTFNGWTEFQGVWKAMVIQPKTKKKFYIPRDRIGYHRESA